MFDLYADKNRMDVREREVMTSGSVNVYRVRFRFSEDWADLTRTAVFRNGTRTVSIPLDESGMCSVPWEVLQEAGRRIEAGAYGTREKDVVLPTVWAILGYVQPGVKPGEAGGSPPTPPGTGALPGGGGTMDHRELEYRDADDQHPMSAIEGLEDALARIPRPMTADELRKILMNGEI